MLKISGLTKISIALKIPQLLSQIVAKIYALKLLINENGKFYQFKATKPQFCICGSELFFRVMESFKLF